MFCLIIGISIGYFHPTDFKVSTTSAIVLTLWLSVLLLATNKPLRNTMGFGLIGYLSFIAIGIFTVSCHNQKQFPTHYSHYINEHIESLTPITFSIREVLKPSQYHNKYIVNIIDVNNKSVKGKLLLNLEKDSLPALTVDGIYKSNVLFKEVPKPLNPNQFDYKSYLKKQYIYHQITCSRPLLFKTQQRRLTLFGLAEKIRNHIILKLKSYNFTPNELSIIKALLLGQRQDINKETYSNYANAGAIHILAVSGLHVGIILLLFSALLKPIEHFKHGKPIKMVLLIGLLWGFAIIAGLSASVTRAVTMFSVVAIAVNLKRPTNIYNTLAVSVFILLLFKPLFLFDVGFQLSYLAVLGIVAIDPLLYKLYQPKYWLLDKLWHTLTVTIAAQFGILPISLFYFHQFPGLFFISNLVIIPVLGLILGLGILVMILSLLNILPSVFVNFYGGIITQMNRFVDWIAKHEEFLFTDLPFNLLYVMAAYIFIITLVRFYIKRNYNTLRLVLIALLFIQLSVIVTDYLKPTNRLVIFHKSRHTLIGHVAKNTIVVAHDLKEKQPTENNIITNYVIGNHINAIKGDTLRSVYLLNKKILLVVDSIGVYHIKSFKPDYVLLRQSPKLNLNRLIDSLQPQQIIADGSNYKSYVAHWKTICEKRKLPFHYTNTMGAFIIDY
ncbi:ComEC/Rec2 family competence protein [Aestuariivivens insulae]|uniref:ComEC/Rec2 family competence protein n=1 Tax=Aestuariivivens insulae TaxID=1621988 RepID=UPI001F5801C0|nr:ComEC/Rec2 family competence protein [Aestuariivivens insulae]